MFEHRLRLWFAQIYLMAKDDMPAEQGPRGRTRVLNGTAIIGLKSDPQGRGKCRCCRSLQLPTHRDVGSAGVAGAFSCRPTGTWEVQVLQEPSAADPQGRGKCRCCNNPERTAPSRLGRRTPYRQALRNPIRRGLIQTRASSSAPDFRRHQANRASGCVVSMLSTASSRLTASSIRSSMP
jgi:hypothetical protein